MGPLGVPSDGWSDSMMFLNQQQLKDLTGYQKPALQRKWLLAHGYRFDVRADGSPALLIEQVRSRQLKGLREYRQAEEAPDFAALDS